MQNKKRKKIKIHKLKNLGTSLKLENKVIVLKPRKKCKKLSYGFNNTFLKKRIRILTTFHVENSQ